jgi:hypothetical protein
MKTEFKTLLTFKVSHTYYSKGCQDFDFILPVRTAQLLQDGRLTAKIHDGQLLLFFAAAAGGNALVPLAGQKLCFGIKLGNPYFANVTQLDFDMKTSTPLYRNAPDKRSLAGEMASVLVGQIFSHALKNVTLPLAVRLISPSGSLVQTETISVTDDRKSVSYDLHDQAGGAYAVEEDFGGMVTKTQYYADTDLVQAGIMGVVELTLDNSFYASPPVFSINFHAREDVLKYYVVARKYTAAEFDQLVVQDQGFLKDKRPEVTFTQVAPPNFTADEIAPEVWGNSDIRVKLFKSQTGVPRQEKARTNIQLAKNGEVLIANLPQLGADKVNGDIIIHLSKP